MGTLKPAPQELHDTVDVSFHGVRYTMTVNVSVDDVLTLEMEEAVNLDRWRGQFSAKYVEDITSKTGSFKKFGVFVRMLLSAARQQSDSVFMDLLTYQDLEALKTKKQQQQQGAGAAAAPSAAAAPVAARPLPPSAAGKRYLILTYASEFDRVHYPLPLAQEEAPEPARLMEIIGQLRSEVARLKAGGSSHKRHSPGLRRHGCRDAGRAGSGDGEGRYSDGDDEDGALDAARRGGSLELAGGGTAAAVLAQRLEAALKERDLLRSRLEAAEVDAEREAGLHRRELRRKAKELQELQEELLQARESLRELRSRCRLLEEDLSTARQRRAGPAAAPASAVAAGPQRSASTGRRLGEPYRWSGGSASSYLAGSSYSKYPGGGGRPGASGSRSAAGSRGASPARAGRAGAAGRGGERPAAQAGTRAQSPGYQRPWIAGSSPAPSSSSRPPSRPGSAPPRPRFDPTEYVRQKRERETASAAARGATFGGGGGPGSRGASPARLSRAPSAAAASPAGSRPGSRGGGGGGFQEYAGGARGTPGYGSAGRQRAAGPESPSAAGAARAQQQQQLSKRGSSSDWGPPGGRDGAASPGRALLSVQRKLSEYVSRCQPAAASGGTAPASAAAVAAHVRRPAPGAAARAPDPGAAASRPPANAGMGASAGAAQGVIAVSVGCVLDDASSEIADIDKRLASLQNFLRTAKAGSGAAAGAAAAAASAGALG